MCIGKIVKSDSHITYVCQMYGPREVEVEPVPADYAFGRFVRIAIRSRQNDDPFASSSMVPVPDKNAEPVTYAIGVIYNTMLQIPACGMLGPRLSNEVQVELFSPDSLAEKRGLIYVMILGMIEKRALPGGKTEILSTMHGVPLLSLELDSEVEIMSEEEVRAFHFFADATNPDNRTPYLHMGYLPHIIAQRNSLLPMVTLRIIEQLEALFPQNPALLSIVKRNFSWKLKVEPTG